MHKHTHTHTYINVYSTEMPQNDAKDKRQLNFQTDSTPLCMLGLNLLLKHKN